ncbi:NmrA family NAD(P)-binding protein [Sphingomonas sp. MG17]|uniref:NmrA family NAD(P)-binding protein n=1 Tax=Sphingomonas tagetis TaxID=2949092 RepID=A0A9X2HJJ6_9SPHN|nr:NmrA family NAD(P)-binding protein [Sphingomonas tagetis]MCP3731237.1 NmrA family NAD(P)-binding protein [Sphingomonas tagetis]
MDNHVFLITGATGAQGGAAVDALLDKGMKVRALVRDPASPAARQLADRGVELVQGDFDDAASLATAMRGVKGVFSVQLPPGREDTDSELRTGRLLVDAARAAGVEIFVHTSVARAGDQTQFVDWDSGRWWPDYWNGKSGVNDVVKAAGFPHWVVLKPAFMMDNFIPPKSAWMFPGLQDGVINSALRADTRLDLIAAADVGRFAAEAFAAPARFDRQDIDLAADSLTMGEVAATLSRVSGRAIESRALNGAGARAAGSNPGLVESQQWANVEGYQVDLATARSWGVPLESFSDWAGRHRDRFSFGTG